MKYHHHHIIKLEDYLSEIKRKKPLLIIQEEIYHFVLSEYHINTIQRLLFKMEYLILTFKMILITSKFKIEVDNNVCKVEEILLVQEHTKPNHL
jgi:hypothetical protein